MKKLALVIVTFFCFSSSVYAVDWKDPPPPPAKVKRKVPVSATETYNSDGSLRSSQTTYEWKTSGGTKPNLIDHGNFKAPPPAKMIKKVPVKETIKTNSKGESTKTVEYEWK